MKRQINIPPDDDMLLRQCAVDVFRATGPGGQHVNTTDSAVRLTHEPSGIVVTSRESRSQLRNKEICLRKLRAEIKKQNFRPRKRIPTKKSRGAKERQLDEKRRHSQKKRTRAKPAIEE